MKRLIIITFLTFCFGTASSQAQDSLSIFPNPFSDSATIYFQIAQSDTVSLRVFDTFGQHVRTYFQSEVLPPRSYNVTLPGDSLKDGIYFVRIEIGSLKSITKKAFKIKTTTAANERKLTAEDLAIFPNPTKELLRIPIGGTRTIVFTDLHGRRLKSITTDQKVVSISELPCGLYNVSLFTDKKELVSIQKIVKIE